MESINICELSNCFNAWKSCNEEWKGKHEERINNLLQLLPSGSGIDAGVNFDWAGSKKDKLIFTFGYHHLNEVGYYDGWTQHKLILTPSFSGYDMKITGADKNMVKDYLYDTFAYIFSFIPNYQLINQQKKHIMKKYVLRDKEAGNFINEYLTLQDAENSLKDFESIDKANNEYTPDFYEIKEVNDPATYLTEKQKESLQDEIYNTLMAIKMYDTEGNEVEIMGMGEMGEAHDEAERIADQWANNNGIVFID